MYYKPQALNPFKHPEMPNEYPWISSTTDLGDGSIEVSQEDYDNIISSVDLTNYNNVVQYENNLKQQTDQREFGIGLIPFLIDYMGERNLTLAQNGQSVNMIAIASDNSSVKLLIETGALKTARSICSQLKQKYPTHADIYDLVIIDISNFLLEKGYE